MGESPVKKIIILGAGGHGRVLLDLMENLRLNFVGFVDEDPSLKGKTICGHKVLGDENYLTNNFRPSEIILVNGIGTTDSTRKREKLFVKMKNLGFHFQTLIHPFSFVSPRAQLAEGVQIMAGAVIQIGSSLGENVIVNTKASLDHDCQIAANCHIAPGATLSGNVTIQKNVHIGTGATIIQGVLLGESSFVAAGSLVCKNIEANCRVKGVPAKPY